jgi:hypothetical protein
VAIGWQAGNLLNSSSQCNVCVGLQAGNNSTSVRNCTYLGYQAAGSMTQSTGYNNTFTGYRSGFVIGTGEDNACYGNQSGVAITSGSRNTFIGTYAGNTNSTLNNSTCIGFGSQCSGSNQVVLGTASETVICPNILNVTGALNVTGNANHTGSIGLQSAQFIYFTDVAGGYTTSTTNYCRLFVNDRTAFVDFYNQRYWRSTRVDGSVPSNVMQLGPTGGLWIAGSLSQNSDYRIKTKLGDALPVLDRICSVPMIMYELATVGMYKPDGTNIGFYAHELQETFPDIENIVVGVKDAIDDEGNIKTQAVNTFQLTNILMKAIQELNEVVKKQQEQINLLLNKNVTIV